MKKTEFRSELKLVNTKNGHWTCVGNIDNDTINSIDVIYDGNGFFMKINKKSPDEILSEGLDKELKKHAKMKDLTKILRDGDEVYYIGTGLMHRVNIDNCEKKNPIGLQLINDEEFFMALTKFGQESIEFPEGETVIFPSKEERDWDNFKRKEVSNEMEKFKEAARPLIKYMAENHHPHKTAIVTSNRVELMEGQMSANLDEYID